MIYAETTVVITTRWAAVIAALTLLLLLGVAHILILSAQPTPTNSANPAKASDPVQAVVSRWPEAGESTVARYYTRHPYAPKEPLHDGGRNERKCHER